MTDEAPKPVKNPEIDEQSAVALAVVINNHITAMKKWERMLTTPFLRRTKFSTFPEYPKPTVATVLAIMVDTLRMHKEVLRINMEFLRAYNAAKKEKQ